MAKFALLLNHAPDRYSGLTKAEYSETMGDYFKWVQDKIQEGAYVGGHKLSTATGKLVTSKTGSIEVHDIPSTEIAEVLGGIMIIEAPDFDSAVDMARAHPHLTHNHNLMVFPVDPGSDG